MASPTEEASPDSGSADSSLAARLLQQLKVPEQEPAQPSQPSVESFAERMGDDPDKTRNHLENKDLNNNIELRTWYGRGFFWLLVTELVVLNGFFLARGLGCLQFNSVDFNVYVGGTLLQTFGVILVIARGLFKA